MSADSGISSSPTRCASGPVSARSSMRSIPRCSRPSIGRPRPQLYVTQTPFVNAGAVGFDDPFIIVNSGTLGLLNREEQRDVLAHELGHIMSGHVTYSTIAVILINFGLRNLPFLAGIALLPIQIALLEWYRKAELSCDRAGLLGHAGSPRVAGDVPEAGRRVRRRRHDRSRRVPHAGRGIRDDGRRLGHGAQDPQHGFPRPSVQHGARGRAPALGQRREAYDADSPRRLPSARRSRGPAAGRRLRGGSRVLRRPKHARSRRRSSRWRRARDAFGQAFRARTRRVDSGTSGGKE